MDEVTRTIHETRGKSAGHVDVLLTVVCLLVSTGPVRGTTWDELHKLTASDGAAMDQFGWSVALSGNRAVIGKFGDSDNGYESGSAYVFDVTTGDELLKLIASDGAIEDRFGQSVAISGNTAVIGAEFDNDDGADSGSAYVFDVTTGDQIFKLTASDAATLDRFGVSVAISGDTAVIGSWLDDDSGFNSGSAYVFDVTTGRLYARTFKLALDDNTGQERTDVLRK